MAHIAGVAFSRTADGTARYDRNERNQRGYSTVEYRQGETRAASRPALIARSGARIRSAQFARSGVGPSQRNASIDEKSGASVRSRANVRNSITSSRLAFRVWASCQPL